MTTDRKKPVKPKGRVARAASGSPAAANETEAKAPSGPLAKGAQAQPPNVAMPVARAPRVTRPGDAEEVEADKAAARVSAGQPTGPVEQQPPAPARKVDTEEPPPVEQVPVAGKGRSTDDGASVAAAGKPAGERKPVARAPADAAAPPRAAPAPVTDAIASPGQGRPLAPATREAIERRMPVDLRGVRVHDDAAAQDAARSIDARAFTHDRDIWLGHGESDRDVGLMAHEAAHVAQQHDGGPEVAPAKDKAAKTKKTKKAEGDLIDRWPTTEDAKAPGSIDPKAGTFTVAVLRVPNFKKEFSSNPNLKTPNKREGKQREDWEAAFGDGPDLAKALPSATPVSKGGKDIYFLKPKKGTSTYVIGTKETVQRRARRPSWTTDGKPHRFDVDHKKEVQLGGADRDVGNMWLLDSESNQASGRLIQREITEKIQKVIDAAPDTLRDKPEDAAEVRDGKKYTSVTATKLMGRTDYPGDASLNYTKEDIESGKSLQALEPVPKDLRERLGGEPDRISLFDRAEGGRQRYVDIEKGEGKLKRPTVSKTVAVTAVHYTPQGNTGSVDAVLFEQVKLIDPIKVTMDIGPVEGIEYGGFVSPYALRTALGKQLKIPPMSAVIIDEAHFDWDEGVLATGSLTPSIPLIDKLGIELRIDGEGVYLSRTFSGDELAFPGPVKVLGSSLEVQFGTQGFLLRGHVPFLIEGFGRGLIEAKAGTSGGTPSFELLGTLELDTELFDKAEVTVHYREGRFSGEGTLEIGPKKLKGVKSATIKAAIDEERIEAAGDVVMDIPGVERGTVALVYDKTTGLEVAGKLQLSNSIPALKSGTIGVTVRKAPEGAWKVSGDIEATAGIPGITATVTGRYEDGAFEVAGTVGYERGMLKGSLSLGATNRPVGDDGKPAGEPTDKLTAYGQGMVTVRLAPWLQGTVGLQVLPKGDVVVSGKVALPSTLDLFPEKKLTKRIFEVHLDIPIAGFSVVGQRVGIFATIGGGMDAEAAIGPGQLRKAELGVTYNPSDEAATHVTGGAELFIPAHAGLRLFVKGGVGAGIPVVSAEVGLEVGATLALEAALTSGLQVDWTPARGLVLDASLSTYVQPKFVFDLTAYARVTVDYLFGTSTLYDERWKLGGFEYGSNLRFGVKFPVHYEETKQFDVALSDVEFEYPQIDTGDLLKGLVKAIV